MVLVNVNYLVILIIYSLCVLLTFCLFQVRMKSCGCWWHATCCDPDSYLVYLLRDVLYLAVEDNRERSLESERIGHWCIDELHRFRISTGKNCFVN